MRLAVCGTQCVGKTTFINAFTERWPMYKKPVGQDYRELVKEHNLDINQKGDQRSQTIIRDWLADYAMNNAHMTHAIHDRSVLDNLVYTLWQAEKGIITDDDFIANSFHITRSCMSFFDIILWIPLNPEIPLTEKENRDTDENYRVEIDNIYSGVFESYKRWEGLIFPKEDSAVMIELKGLTVEEKIEEIAQYINDEGNLIETDNSVLGNLEAVYDEMALLKQVKGEN